MEEFVKMQQNIKGRQSVKTKNINKKLVSAKGFLWYIGAQNFFIVLEIESNLSFIDCDTHLQFQVTAVLG